MTTNSGAAPIALWGRTLKKTLQSKLGQKAKKPLFCSGFFSSLGMMRVILVPGRELESPHLAIHGPEP
ncbi:MAG: hypothetical protein ACREXG_04615, partial [Polaromonas sp.]